MSQTHDWEVPEGTVWPFEAPALRRSQTAEKFERQFARWGRLNRLAGYPSAYRDLFAELRCARLLPDGLHRVLDGGSGNGSLAAEYIRIMPHARVCALDLSSKMLAVARCSIGQHATFLSSDVAELPVANESFDAVISSHCLEHTPEPRATLAEMTRVLRPDGLLVAITARPHGLSAVFGGIWNHRCLEAADVLRWMWETGTSPLGMMSLGPRCAPAHWLSHAMIGRKGAS